MMATNRSFVPSTLHDLSIGLLDQNCREQIRRFTKSHGAHKNSDCCDEIVRRAFQAGEPDREARNVLLQISWEIVLRACSNPAEREDIAQEVILRLLRRFTRSIAFDSFPHYYAYLNVTIRNVEIDAQSSSFVSLEKMEDRGIQAVETPVEEQAQQQLLLQSCLKILTKPLERDVFVHRYVDGETVNEIVEDLQQAWPGIDSATVYDAAADALRRIRTHLGLKSLRKSD